MNEVEIIIGSTVESFEKHNLTYCPSELITDILVEHEVECLYSKFASFHDSYLYWAADTSSMEWCIFTFFSCQKWC